VSKKSRTDGTRSGDLFARITCQHPTSPVFLWPLLFCLFACINRPTTRTATTRRKHIHSPHTVMAQQASAPKTKKGTLDPSSIARKEDEAQQPLYDPRSLQYLEPTQTSLQCSVCCEYFTEPVSAPCGYASSPSLSLCLCLGLCSLGISPHSLYFRRFILVIHSAMGASCKRWRSATAVHSAGP